MASSLSPQVLATLIGVLLIPSAGATNGPDDLAQQPLQRTGCLPGPFIHDAYPTCVTAVDGASSWVPWTHRPHCLDDAEYCVFTNSDFPGHNRGVSIIDVRPSNNANDTSAVGSISRLISNRPPSPELFNDESPPYEIRDIPGKGKGLIATRKIPRGHLFMVDYAAVIADEQFPSRVKREDGRQLLREAVDRLSGAEEVLNLARGSSELGNVPVVENVMKTNSFSVEIGGRGYMALFPRIARMNHACRPSALTRFNATTLYNTVTAFHDILPGEELTISYSPFGLPSQARHKILQSKWGFTCTCTLCSSTPSDLAASDARRDKISKLGKEVIDLVESGQKQDLKQAVRLYTEAVEAVEEEGLVPHMGNHYRVLGQLWAASGDRKTGEEWVRRGRAEEEGFEEPAI